MKELEPFIGKEITYVEFHNDRDSSKIIIKFNDCSFEIEDTASYCCESRYLTTDDNPLDLIGHEFLSITLKEGPTEAQDYGEQGDTTFIEIQADHICITFVAHNEHNGYYAGFDISLKTNPPIVSIPTKT